MDDFNLPMSQRSHSLGSSLKVHMTTLRLAGGMDDSTLKALSVTSKSSNTLISLTPAFQNTIKSYSCVVESSIDGRLHINLAVTVKAVCNEGDAFCQG
jgi:hypothetical protein